MAITRSTLRNGAVFIVVCIAYFVYVRFVANAVPDSGGGEVNVIVVPFVLGAICAFASVGHLALRIALLVAAAVLVLLTITGGGDQAKPGLHLWVVGGMVLIAAIGMLCAAFAARLMTRDGRQAWIDARNAGEPKVPARRPGDHDLKVLEDAPGSYAMLRLGSKKKKRSK
jgi:hypothetical protein